MTDFSEQVQSPTARLDRRDLTIERIEVIPVCAPLGRRFSAATTR